MADFEIITEGTLGATASSITFSAIPQTYKHLELQLSLRSTNFSATTSSGYLYFNTNTGANIYGRNVAYVAGSSANGAAINTQMGYLNKVNNALRINDDAQNTGSHGTNKLLICDYASTVKTQKDVFFQQVAGSAWSSSATWASFGGGGYTSGAAGISTITFVGDYSFKTGCTYWLAGWK